VNFTMKHTCRSENLLPVAAVLSVCLFAPSSGFAQEVFSLDRVQKTIRSDNPEILAAVERLNSARNSEPQSYLPDKPVLTYERMTAPGMGGQGVSHENNLLLTQTIPFPSTLYWRGKVAAGSIAIAEQEYAAVVRRIAAEARTGYAQLFAAGKAIDLFAENIDIMRRLASIAETKYSIGHATKSDVLKAQVEVSKMISMRIALIQEKEIASARLNALMNRPARTPLAVADDYQPSELSQAATTYAASTLNYNPSVKAMRLSVEQGGRSLSLAKSDYYPDIMLGYRKRNSSDTDMDGTQDFMFGFSIPLWFSKQRSMVDAAQARKNAAELELQNVSNAALYETQEYFTKASAMRSLLELYKTAIIPQAEEALKTAESGYQSEKTGFMDLLDAQRTLLSFKLEYYRYLFEHERWIAELEKTAGKM